MKWRKGGNYFIVCPPYAISKAMVRGADTFTLWHLSEPLGIYDDAKQARKAADADQLTRGSA